MEWLTKKILQYGPISIIFHYGHYETGCMVTLPAEIQKSFVKTTNTNLYRALHELLELVKLENNRLWQIQRAPKQGGLFNYGAENKDWKEIA